MKVNRFPTKYHKRLSTTFIISIKLFLNNDYIVTKIPSHCKIHHPIFFTNFQCFTTYFLKTEHLEIFLKVTKLSDSGHFFHVVSHIHVHKNIYCIARVVVLAFQIQAAKYYKTIDKIVLIVKTIQSSRINIYCTII